MRDMEIYQSLRNLEKKMGEDCGAMLRAISVVETRQKALEQFLFSSRWALLKVALLQVLSPARAREALMRTHGIMLRQYGEKMKKAIEEKNKQIRTAPVPGPVISLALVFLAFLAPGCVSLGKYKEAQLQLVAVATERDIAARTANFCTEQQVKLIEILRKFNQVDEKGNLRDPKPKAK